MFKQSHKTIYLDYASATPLDKSIAKKICLIESKLFANPSAIHKEGVESRKAIDDARTKTAQLLYAHSDEIVFTSSGTEGNALAILGVINNYELQSNNQQDRVLPHIITTEIEHPSILENCKILETSKKAVVTYLPINERGIVDPKDVRDALTENTVLVSVMYANNEIGTVQPIREIAKEIRHFRKMRNSSLVAGKQEWVYPLFHTDACQAVNYLPIENIEKLGVDLLSFNSSKIYGPKGVGVLYKKRGTQIAAIYQGGGQEFGLRSGTENVAGIVGIAKAFELACKIKEKESNRLIKIRDYGIEKLLELSKTSECEIILNGDRVNRLPNNINVSILGISSELLVIELDAKGIQVSAKSACKSDEPDESYVISALRKAQNIQSHNVDGSLRISLGRETKKGDIDVLFNTLKEILEKYRNWK